MNKTRGIQKSLSRLPEATPQWFLLLAPAIALGAALRLYMLPGQILLDDEWHSLNFVIGKTFFEVFSSQGLGANCIPQNLYNWALFYTIGWSEILLRLPSIICGITALLVFPLLALKIFGQGRSLIFAWLLAISPCVTFYSRLCRPYSMVLFFGFLSLFSLVLWLRRGKISFMLFYAVSGFTSIYYHLYAAMPVLTPLICLFVFALSPQSVRHRLARKYSLPCIQQISIALAVVAGLSLLFLVPANIGNPWWQNMHGVDRFTIGTFSNFLALLSGTHVPELKVAFALLCGLGFLFLMYYDLAFGIMAISIWLAFFTYISFSTQDGMHAAIQIARYGITLFPLAFLLVSIGLTGLFTETGFFVLHKRWQFFLSSLFIATLLWTGPLRGTYASPNNFTNQSAFQDSYEPFDWSKSRVRDLTPLPQMKKSDIPALYFDSSALAPLSGIIEYPQFIGDPLNLYYFYQHFHKKNVAAGYIPELRFRQLPSKDDFVYQTTPVDYVFSRAVASQEGRFDFKNMVPLTDLHLLVKQYRDWIVVVHKNLFAEMFPEEMESRGEVYQPSAIIADYLQKNIGRPFYEDKKIVVWKIQ